MRRAVEAEIATHRAELAKSRPGCISGIAKRHGISTQTVRTWFRRLYGGRRQPKRPPPGGRSPRCVCGRPLTFSTTLDGRGVESCTCGYLAPFTGRPRWQ